MYTQTASQDDHHTPTGWKRWAYSTNHKVYWYNVFNFCQFLQELLVQLFQY